MILILLWLLGMPLGLIILLFLLGLARVNRPRAQLGATVHPPEAAVAAALCGTLPVAVGRADVDRVGEAIGRHGPVAGQETDHVLLRVDGGQTLVDQAVDIARALVRFEERVEHGGLTDERLHGRAAARRLRDRGHRLAPSEGQSRRADHAKRRRIAPEQTTRRRKWG